MQESKAESEDVMSEGAAPELLLAGLRHAARDAPESGIVEVMNYGRRRNGVIGLWAGEGDLSTPAFITEAAARALAAGETFYTWQRGIPELRRALAGYHTRLYGREFSAEEFFVTGSGMQAIQIALAMTAGEGDEVVIPTPTWPNAAAAAGIAGARPVSVAMTFGNQGWTLDRDRLAAAINTRTRAIVVVSPSNPTGWTASRDDLVALLAIARRHGLWIIADETYARFWYGEGPRAPSFYDVMAAEDRVLFVNTFSKNWAMTGWRMGGSQRIPRSGRRSKISFNIRPRALRNSCNAQASWPSSKATTSSPVRSHARGRAATSFARCWRAAAAAVSRYRAALSTCCSRLKARQTRAASPFA